MPRRVLFVFSTDHGEVVNADLFCRGQGFYVGGLLPAGSGMDVSGFCNNVSEYRNGNEIFDLVRKFNPDLIVLASAYLFTINDLMSPQQFSELFERLRGTDRPVATTDPWMGFWRTHPDAKVNLFGIRDAGRRVRMELAMRQHLHQLDDLLDDACHLYATPYVDVERQSFSFFNATQPPGFEGHDTGGENTIAFILSRQDYLVQLRKHGWTFHENLVSCFQHLLQDERTRITFIAPEQCRQVVGELIESPRLNNSGFIGLEQFRPSIERASLVVYWNLISSSLLYAYYAHKPIAYFDIGHQAELAEHLFHHACKHIYQGVVPDIVDLNNQTLSLEGCRFDYLRGYNGTRPGDILDNLCLPGTGSAS